MLPTATNLGESLSTLSRPDPCLTLHPPPLLSPAWQPPDMSLQAFSHSSTHYGDHHVELNVSGDSSASVPSQPLEPFSRLPIVDGRPMSHAAMPMASQMENANRDVWQQALNHVQWKQVFDLLQLCPTPEAVEACLHALTQSLPQAPAACSPALQNDHATLQHWQQQAQAAIPSLADLGLNQLQARYASTMFGAIEYGRLTALARG